MEAKSIKFLCSGNKLWKGGVYYLKNFLNHVGESNKVTILIHDFDLKAQSLLDESGVRYELVHSKEILLWFNRFFLRLGFSFVRRIQADYDIVFYHGVVPLSVKNRNKLVFWIPDLLHLKASKDLSYMHLLNRWIWLKFNLMYSNSFLVSSNTMKNELSSMEKVPLNRILVYRFPSYATYIPDERLDKWENMILIPHEWWKHKNHLGLLGFMEINTSYCFIFTGNTRTEDTNGTFYNFERLAKEKGLTNYRVLGVVSHEYLMTLFNQSAVVVNVSLNEGWNTSVEMGKSLGKTLLLSKIKVHEEQVANYPNVIWFNKGLHLKGTQVLEKASQFNYNDEVEGNLARFNADIAQIAK